MEEKMTAHDEQGRLMTKDYREIEIEDRKALIRDALYITIMLFFLVMSVTVVYTFWSQHIGSLLIQWFQDQHQYAVDYHFCVQHFGGRC